jgi:DNA-binding PadR family transcriptional regulator
MTMQAVGRRSGLGLAVLGLLADEPMHAYGIQKALRRHGRDRLVNVRQRASVYQAVDRLLRLGLIRVLARARGDNRPERTVYELTDEGRVAAAEWVREMLLATDDGFPEFPVGLSFLSLLAPEDARHQLEARALAITDELATTEATGLEGEYRRVVLGAQLTWLRSVLAGALPDTGQDRYRTQGKRSRFAPGPPSSLARQGPS